MPAESHLLLRAARREQTERTPVWLMRQAGRFDPAYRALRESAHLPLEEAFRTPDLAAEISLLPGRFGVDAIIMFQDILTPLDALDCRFVFRPGPQLENPVRSAGDVQRLCDRTGLEGIEHVPRTIGLIRSSLDGALPLLGFAGAPLTLAFFLIAGASPTTGAEAATAMMRAEPARFAALLKRLTSMTIDYLRLQIDAGVDAVQLFESCADMIDEADYDRWAHPTHVEIFRALGDRVPRILFAKDQQRYERMADSGADVISLCAGVDLGAARSRVGDRVAIQGNVDNYRMVSATPEEVEVMTASCLAAGAGQGHILNLGHGLLKDTPVENVERFIATARQFRHRPAG